MVPGLQILLAQVLDIFELPENERARQTIPAGFAEFPTHVTVTTSKIKWLL